MTSVIANKAYTNRAVPILLFVVLAVAGLIGVVRYPRAPDFTMAPVMAEQPVVLPNQAPIYVQKYEVSVAEWNTCHAAGACTLALRVNGKHIPEKTPATGLSFVDISQYIEWINAATGLKYRLPTLQEWEFMAAEVMPPVPDPIFTDPQLTWASAYLTEPQINRTLRPQGTFDTTAQGIVDLNGNVWEWTQECYTGVGEPKIAIDRCPAFYVGGEHVAVVSFLERDPARGGCAVGVPPAHLGMRLVSDRDIPSKDQG